MLDGVSPAGEYHALLGSIHPLLVASQHHIHQLVVFLALDGAHMDSLLNDGLLVLPQLVLRLDVLPPLDVDHILVDHGLVDLSKELALAVLGHELCQARSEHEELGLLPVLDGSSEDGLLVNDLVYSIFPGAELLGCLGSCHSHEVVTELLVSFIPPQLLLAQDEVTLSGVSLLTPGDFLLALLDLSDELVLVVDQFALKSEVCIDHPSFESNSLSELLDLAKDSQPVLS